MADGGCNGYRPDDEGWGRGERPAINVGWNDAQRYLEWLSRKSGKTYRFPSESEWEYAARAGTTAAWSSGEGSGRACNYANVSDRTGKRENRSVFEMPHHDCDDGYAKTAPVGSFAANAFGVHDMLGNVWELLEDCMPTDESARRRVDCNLRLLRGGSWTNGPAEDARWLPVWTGTEYRIWTIGFRAARTLD